MIISLSWLLTVMKPVLVFIPFRYTVSDRSHDTAKMKGELQNVKVHNVPDAAKDI